MLALFIKTLIFNPPTGQWTEKLPIRWKPRVNKTFVHLVKHYKQEKRVTNIFLSHGQLLSVYSSHLQKSTRRGCVFCPSRLGSCIQLERSLFLGKVKTQLQKKLVKSKQIRPESCNWRHFFFFPKWEDQPHKESQLYNIIGHLGGVYVKAFIVACIFSKYFQRNTKYSKV